MINNLYFQISGLLIILFLLKVYFSKKRKNSIDNNIFQILISANLIGLVFDFLSAYSTLYLGNEVIISELLAKLDLSAILIWILSLTLYIHVISFKKKERLTYLEDISVKKMFIKKIYIFILTLIFVFILPIDINNENTVFFSGSAVYFLCGIIICCIFYWMYRYITRLKYIKRKHSNLILTFSLIGIAAVVLQILYPELILSNFIIYFITFIMFFSIENPDLELIEELEASKKQIEEVEAMKTDTLLKISHEIRTPLNTIIGFSQSILEGSTESIEEDVQYIKEASESLLKIADNILDISNADNQGLNLIYNEYNFDVLIKQIIALVNSKLDESKVEFRFKVNNNIPPFLYGDSIRLKQAVMNILYNSLKYTKEGYINLDVNSITIGNVCRLIININDTGIGIPEDKFENLFKEKPSDNKELEEEEVETSLVNIKRIIESMGGKMFAESEYGEGTSVKISVDQKIVNEEESETKTEEKKEEIDFSKKKVLVVDDDIINLKVAERLLKNYNVQVETLSSGLKCIEKIDNGENYDLIFMDDMMPDLSGTETLRQLNSSKGFNIPVVALTANALYGMKEKYLKKGFDDYISKPIERKELDRVIQKFLKK